VSRQADVQLTIYQRHPSGNDIALGTVRIRPVFQDQVKVLQFFSFSVALFLKN